MFDLQIISHVVVILHCQHFHFIILITHMVIKYWNNYVHLPSSGMQLHTSYCYIAAVFIDPKKLPLILLDLIIFLLHFMMFNFSYFVIMCLMYLTISRYCHVYYNSIFTVCVRYNHDGAQWMFFCHCICLFDMLMDFDNG